MTFAVGDRPCVFGIFIEQLNTHLPLGCGLEFDCFDSFLVVAGDHAPRLRLAKLPVAKIQSISSG